MMSLNKMKQEYTDLMNKESAYAKKDKKEIVFSKKTKPQKSPMKESSRTYNVSSSVQKGTPTQNSLIRSTRRKLKSRNQQGTTIITMVGFLETHPQSEEKNHRSILVVKTIVK
jgi:hypothetical protein